MRASCISNEGRWHCLGAHNDRYARAKADQADFLAEELLEIADDSAEDEIFTEEGKRLENREFINRSRLRVDTRKWIACKLLPKIYGEKQQSEVGLSESLMQKIIDKL